MIIILRAVVQEQVGKVNILAVWKSMQIKPFGEDYSRPNFPNMFWKTSLIMITMVIKMMIGNHKSLRHGEEEEEEEGWWSADGCRQ